MSFNIGLDVSGGDNAPQEIVKGAVLARKEYGYDITLIGVKEEIDRELAKYPGMAKRFSDSSRSGKSSHG